MTPKQRTWARELQDVRNDWAHSTGKGLTDDDATRALDTMARFIEPIDNETADEIRKLYRHVMYKSEDSSKVKQAEQPSPATASAMPYARPWRQIAEPHQDVAQGRFRQAEFAADLSQVLR